MEMDLRIIRIPVMDSNNYNDDYFNLNKNGITASALSER